MVDQIIAHYAVVPDERQLCIETEMLDPSGLAPTDALIEAETTVISAGTELATYTALAPGVRRPGNWNSYPWRPGYGLVGRVLEAGAMVPSMNAGERVFCFGRHASVQLYDTSAVNPPGGIFHLDEDICAETSVMLRIGLIAMTALQVCRIAPGDTVAVFGLGLVGNMAAQLFQSAGARVIGLDPVAIRCDLAKEVGIETVLNVAPEDQAAALRELTGGKGVQIAVDAVGHSNVIVNCVEACASHGQVILLGSPRASVQGDLTPAFQAIHNRWISVQGALEWRLPLYRGTGIRHSTESNLCCLIDFVRRGTLQVKPLITHVVSPNKIGEAYEGLLNDQSNYLGVVVDWRGAL
jgi:2-desacetyl-2-hydroxyethyl bacteriochlorophyllide A dehydrogenase